MTDGRGRRLSIDLNADLGEWDSTSPAAEEARLADLRLMGQVTSVNVACGGHCGDLGSMRATVGAALDHGVAIGAHPSFADREGFGRRDLAPAPDLLRHAIAGQIAALAGVAAAAGTRLSHVKPHGALYTLAARERSVADCIVRAVADVDDRMAVVGPSGSELLSAARAAGLGIAAEVFADRAYADDGRLLPRGRAGAMIDDPEAAAERLVRIVREGRVATAGGLEIAVEADTACLHGDTPGAAAMARAIRRALAAADIDVRAATARR